MSTATDKDMMFFYSVLKHMDMKSLPPTDWDLVAADMGLKNKAVAKVRFGQIRKKLGDAISGETPSKKKAPKRKIDADGNEEDDEAVKDECDEDEPKTPKKPRTPKTPKTPASRKKVKTEPQVFEQAEDDIAVVVAAGDVLADADEIPF